MLPTLLLKKKGAPFTLTTPPKLLTLPPPPMFHHHYIGTQRNTESTIKRLNSWLSGIWKPWYQTYVNHLVACVAEEDTRVLYIESHLHRSKLGPDYMVDYFTVYNWFTLFTTFEVRFKCVFGRFVCARFCESAVESAGFEQQNQNLKSLLMVWGISPSRRGIVGGEFPPISVHSQPMIKNRKHWSTLESASDNLVLGCCFLPLPSVSGLFFSYTFFLTVITKVRK
jgi:hypothetical protein